MEHLVGAIEQAVANKNWYAALSLALTMPDICGKLEHPKKKSQERFEPWYDKYLLSAYQSQIGPMRTLHTFLFASDCYALRCAYLHQGEFGIEDQRAQTALARFHFTEPPEGGSMHNNQFDNVLQLQVDEFCKDVCAAVRRWMDDVAANQEVQTRIEKLGRIAPAPW